MKYSYFAPLKSGKFLIRSLFQYNKKSYSLHNCGYTTFSLITKPTVDNYHIMEWNWEVKYTHEVKTWYELRHLETLDEVINQKIEMWSPFDEDYFGKRNSLQFPINLYKTFTKFYESDMCVNPLPTLGYSNPIGSRELNWDIRKRLPTMNTDISFVVDELKNRYNVIAYKEDKLHWVTNFFLDGNPLILEEYGEDAYVDYVTKHIDENIRYIKLLKKLLDSYRIPYEMFNLDRDDYCKTFGLSKDIDRSSTDERFCSLPHEHREKVNQWAKNYLKHN
tara:strand:+ start:963 stop:1793 length:831 start_codon:yes stop_codon:yes gene_type:complete